MRYVRYKPVIGYKKYAGVISAYLNVQIALLSILMSIGIGEYVILTISVIAIVVFTLARNRIASEIKLYLVLLLPNAISLIAINAIIR